MTTTSTDGSNRAQAGFAFARGAYAAAAEGCAVIAAFLILAERQESRWGYREWDVLEAYYLNPYLIALQLSGTIFVGAVAWLVIRAPRSRWLRAVLYLVAPAALFLSVFLQLALR